MWEYANDYRKNVIPQPKMMNQNMWEYANDYRKGEGGRLLRLMPTRGRVAPGIG